MCVCIKRFIDEELAYVMWGLVSSNFWFGSAGEDPGEPVVEVKFKGSLLVNSFLLKGGWSFCSIQAFN